MGFEIDRIILRLVRLPQREPFVTSGWVTDGKTPIIVEIQGAGISGFGECAVPLFPFYNHETPRTALHVIKDFALPLIEKSRPETPQAMAQCLKKIIGNFFARAGLEMAYWDFAAKRAGQPLYKFLGGERNRIDVGVSIGIQKDDLSLLNQVEKYLNQGYKRIKLKIGPGKDRSLVEVVTKQFPDIRLMLDANSAYHPKDLSLLKELDQFNLLMIEQPFRDGDLYEHSKLQALMRTPICLDESITCIEDAETALAMKSCRIINIKPGRVGGLTEALKIHDLCQKAGIPVWCGGMLETGIGRAANMALATLAGFTLPGDISESGRYYLEDVVSPSINLEDGGTLSLLNSPGIGFAVNLDKLDEYTLEKLELEIK